MDRGVTRSSRGLRLVLREPLTAPRLPGPRRDESLQSWWWDEACNGLDVSFGPGDPPLSGRGQLAWCKQSRVSTVMAFFSRTKPTVPCPHPWYRETHASASACMHTNLQLSKASVHSINLSPENRTKDRSWLLASPFLYGSGTGKAFLKSENIFRIMLSWRPKCRIPNELLYLTFADCGWLFFK